MKANSWLRGLACLAVLASLFAPTGCGVLAAGRTDFPAQAEGTDGQDLFVEDVEAIVYDPQLSTDEQREALRELGIEDEDLLDVLLTLQ